MSKKSKRKSTKDVPYSPLDTQEVECKPGYTTTLAYILDQDEVNELISAPSFVHEEMSNKVQADGSTYSAEEANSLVNDGPYPKKLKRKKSHGNE